MLIGHSLSMSARMIRNIGRRTPSAFNPASLFANCEQGLWYDIGDFDRYMSELGPNSVVNGDFSNGTTGWTVHPLNTVVGGRLEVRNTDLPFNTRARQGQPFDGAGWYRIRGSLENVSMQEYCTVQSRAVSDNALIAGGIASSFFPVGSHTFDFSFYASAAFYINVTVDTTVSDASRICYVDNIRCEKLTAIGTATLFQDAAGTIPVTAVEQPVGLILDKSKGLVLGPELCAGNDLSTLSATTNASKTDTSFTTTIGGAGAVRDNVFVTGKRYSLSISGVTSASELTVNSAPAGYSSRTILRTGFGNVIFRAVEPNLYLRHSTEGVSSNISISIRELPGNHASQATTTARGVLRARYNLLTYSEDFSNAAWVKSGSPTLTNLGAGIWRLQAIAGSSWLLYQNIPRPSAESCKFTIEVKSNGGGSNFRTMQKGLYSTSVTATTEWTRISSTPGTNDGSGAVGIVFDAANSEIDILIRFPDLRPANLPESLPPYQRIAAATDYDKAGFPVYIDIDGTDDSYQTGSIDFSGTDKMAILAGMRKLDDTVRMLCELSASWAANNGGFSLNTGGVTPDNLFYFSGSRGTAGASLTQGGRVPTTYTQAIAPDSAVITAQHDIAGDLSRIRRNGSSDGAIDGTVDKGTGNFGNYPLYLFSRGGTSLRWKGQFYGLIIRGAATDTTQLEQTEQWLNSKMGGIY